MSLLTGKKVHLTAIEDNDIREITRWHQDVAFMRLYDGTPAKPRTENEIRHEIQEIQRDNNAFIFGIRPLNSEALTGIIGLSGILWNHGTAWLNIGIGREDQRGRGYGTEAMALMLNFAFQELNLHRVQLTVFAYNAGARAMYERLGFTQEGIYRQFLHRDGERHDMLLYGILRYEWRA